MGKYTVPNHYNNDRAYYNHILISMVFNRYIGAVPKVTTMPVCQAWYAPGQ